MKRLITRVSDDTNKALKAEKLEGFATLNLQGLGSMTIDLSQLVKANDFENAFYYDSIIVLDDFDFDDKKVTNLGAGKRRELKDKKVASVQFTYNGFDNGICIYDFTTKQFIASLNLSLLIYFGK